MRSNQRAGTKNQEALSQTEWTRPTPLREEGSHTDRLEQTDRMTGDASHQGTHCAERMSFAIPERSQVLKVRAKAEWRRITTHAQEQCGGRRQGERRCWGDEPQKQHSLSELMTKSARRAKRVQWCGKLGHWPMEGAWPIPKLLFSPLPTYTSWCKHCTPLLTHQGNDISGFLLAKGKGHRYKNCCKLRADRANKTLNLALRKVVRFVKDVEGALPLLTRRHRVY